MLANMCLIGLFPFMFKMGTEICYWWRSKFSYKRNNPAIEHKPMLHNMKLLRTEWYVESW